MSDEQRTRRRTRNQPSPDEAGAPGAGGPGDSPELAEIRERAERLRNLGSGIIQNALSGNSERFLQHSRQQGGQ